MFSGVARTPSATTLALPVTGAPGSKHTTPADASTRQVGGRGRSMSSSSLPTSDAPSRSSNTSSQGRVARLRNAICVETLAIVHTVAWFRPAAGEAASAGFTANEAAQRKVGMGALAGRSAGYSSRQHRLRQVEQILGDQRFEVAALVANAVLCDNSAEGGMTQVARNLTTADEGFLRGVHLLILDRDPLHSGAFRNLLRDSGVKPLLLPARSPNLNAFAERFVGSIKSECLDRIVPLGEKHLRATVRAFMDHYHRERPHQGLGNKLVAPKTTRLGPGPVRYRERLGGVLKFYDREAA